MANGATGMLLRGVDAPLPHSLGSGFTTPEDKETAELTLQLMPS